MSNQVLAKFTKTGLYFDGSAFNATREDAKRLEASDTLADNFKLAWGEGIEIESDSKKSLALQIHEGKLDKYTAAVKYVRERQWEGQRSFSIRTASGEYVSRVVHLPNSGIDRSAWIKLCGNEVVIVWSLGELALEWAS